MTALKQKLSRMNQIIDELDEIADFLFYTQQPYEGYGIILRFIVSSLETLQDTINNGEEI